jgi:fumarate reductase flavoprotein subunit
MTAAVSVEHLDTDILVLGAGGAGLFAALHAHRAAPGCSVTIAVKGLLGKCGCTRMVQGGYNVALHPADSPERHFMDTVEGGQWLNDQELAWTLVTRAAARVRELENDLGCFFDRNPDGTLHQKPFAGQSFDRTVHKGSLTGIEIVNRLAERVRARPIATLEDHRALALIPAAGGGRLAGALLLDMRTGGFRLVRARAVLLATGGGPSMYLYHTPSGDKSGDGMAMALRAGLPLRDLEMVQFHPTGLVADHDTRIAGTIIEEGLRGAGGLLLDGGGQRFMHRYDPRGERATRDIVSRAMFEEMRQGRTGPGGGLFLTMRHLDPGFVRREFRGMVDRCRDVGFDLVGGLVEVVPTAHYMMGGLPFRPDGSTTLPGLYAAGEDTGGVHGANRLGGNGVANSTVFGGIAGDTMARDIGGDQGCSRPWAEPDLAAVDAAVDDALRPFGRPAGDVHALRRRLHRVMWDDVGIVRDGAGLARATAALDELAGQLNAIGPGSGSPAFNLTWHEWLNLRNQILVGRAIAAAALAREDSRGAHFRSDFPRPSDLAASANTFVRLAGSRIAVELQPVAFTRVRPGATLVATLAKDA